MMSPLQLGILEILSICVVYLCQHTVSYIRTICACWCRIEQDRERLDQVGILKEFTAFDSVEVLFFQGLDIE